MHTGIPGLDRILEGGFLPGCMYALAGASGSGKTVLANQIAHARADGGHRTVYVTLMTESHSRMLENLRTLSFFDPRHAGSEVIYVSGHGPLMESGLEGVVGVIDAEVVRRGASMVVVDGLLASAISEATLDVRALLNRLRAGLDMRRVTGLMTMRGEASGSEALYPMADGLVILSQQMIGARQVRSVRVQKYRGSVNLGGEHELLIDEDGVQVYPRIEALARRAPSEEPLPTGLREFGIEGLDRMLQGGLAAASVAEIIGPPGSGKTLHGLSFLSAGAEAGERGLHLGLFESPAALVVHGERIGLPLRQHRDAGLIDMLWHPASEGHVDQILGDLIARAEREGIQRIVIDGYSGLKQTAAFPERVHGALAATNHDLRSLGATVLVTVEDPVSGPATIYPHPTSALIDTAIVLRHAELDARLRRLISIIKVRGSAFDPTIRELEITGDGIQVLGAFDRTRRLVAGQPAAGEVSS